MKLRKKYHDKDIESWKGVAMKEVIQPFILVTAKINFKLKPYSLLRLRFIYLIMCALNISIKIHVIVFILINMQIPG